MPVSLFSWSPTRSWSDATTGAAPALRHAGNALAIGIALTAGLVFLLTLLAIDGQDFLVPIVSGRGSYPALLTTGVQSGHVRFLHCRTGCAAGRAACTRRSISGYSS